MADRLSTLLPDNLKSRISCVYIAKRSFTDDSGKSVEFQRLVIELLIKGEIFDLEHKPEKKDVAMLALAGVVDKPQQAF